MRTVLLVGLFGCAAAACLGHAVTAAEPLGFREVALVCPADVAAPDCDRTNAVDVLAQPVALVTECAQVGQHLATHLSLAPGQRHKITCERRKG